MNIKLLAIDLDGTLLDKDSQVPAENRQMVQAAMDAGIEVMLVTGRSWRATKPIYDQLGLTGPAICYLGALVLDGRTGQVLQHRPLDPVAWQRLRSFALAEGLALTAAQAIDLAVADGALPAQGLVAADTAFATRRADDFAGWEEWNPYTEIDPSLSTCLNPPTMAAVYGDRSARLALAAFPDGLPNAQFDLSDHIAGETVLHVWHRSVQKGIALAEHCRQRSLDPAHVMAMGDHKMDVPMLTFAGVGVAVPTARPEALAAADLIATPAEAIRRILKG